MPVLKGNPKSYSDHRDEARARIAVISAAGRDIGAIPAVADPFRKGRSGSSLRLFIETYLIKLFSVRGEHWPWSQTHLDVIRMAEEAILHGKLFAIAMARGGGKTSLTKAAAMWGILYGYRRWICVLTATAPKSSAFIQDLQTIGETNPLLLADFPEVFIPIKRLERITNRQRGQTCMGRPTRVVWNSDEIVMPDVPGSRCAGSIITSIGLDGAGIRGQVRAMPDGSQLRPDLVLIDDPQTDESAKSEFQTSERLSLLGGAVLEMGPPGIPLAGLMTVTVIREGDLADKSLEDPRWHGIRSPMLIRFPVHRGATPPDVPHEDHWDKYAALLSAGRIEEATAFYAAHRALPECLPILDQPRPCASCPIRNECMDADAIVSWQHRKYPDDLSPIQHAMDRHIRNPALFAAEMQQSPISSRLAGVRITPAQMIQRVTGLPVTHVPAAATLLTAGVDVHDEILYWAVVAWEPDFTGQVIQYGTYPEQPGRWFRQAAPPRPLSQEFPGMDKDGVIQAGLERLCGVMLAHEYEKYAGGTVTSMAVEKMLVDSGYKPTLVYNVRRKLANPIMGASLGRAIGAKAKPVAAYQRRPGWKFGDNWYSPSVRGTREYPHTVIDTNYWKTFLHRSLATAPGTRGAMTLYGTPATAGDHEPFAEHVAASEFFTEVFANGRVVCEYQIMPGRPDNHWLDCMVMATVAASIMGCKPPAESAEAATVKRGTRAERRTVSFAQMRKGQ